METKQNKLFCGNTGYMAKFLKSLKYFTLGLILNIIYLIPNILAVLVILMFMLFRYFLGIYLNIKHSQKIQFIHGSDAVFSLNQNEMVIHGFLIVQGKLKLQEIENRVKFTLTDARKLDGSYKYIRLRCFIKKSCGFLYWLLDDNFCLKNHIQTYQCTPPKDENELQQVISKISDDPMSPEKPPWIINVLQLPEIFFDTDHYVLFMSCHHSVSDAVALVRLLGYCFLDDQYDQMVSARSYLNTHQKSPKLVACKFLKSLFLTPYYLTKQVIQQDRSILHRPRLSGKKHCRMSKPVSLERIKNIKNCTKTTVNDVLMSCVGAALKSHFLAEGVKAPRKIHAAIAVTFHTLNEEPKLKNKCSSVTYKFVPEVDSCIARLMRANRQMEQLKTKLFLPINLLSLHLVNLVPSCITRIFFGLIGTTFIISNVPGPQMPCYSNGNIVTMFGGFVPHINKTGIGITFLSFNGQVNFAMCVDNAIMSNLNVIDRFLGFCVDEVSKLEREIEAKC